MFFTFLIAFTSSSHILNIRYILRFNIRAIETAFIAVVVVEFDFVGDVDVGIVVSDVGSDIDASVGVVVTCSFAFFNAF